MKKIFFPIALLILSLLIITSCSKNSGNTPQADQTQQETDAPETQAPEKKYVFGDISYATLKNKPFYKIFEAPDAEPRQVVLDYMRKMAMIEWVATESWTTTWKNEGSFSVNLSYQKGKTYYGLPYSRAGTDFNCFMEYVEDGKFTPNSHYYEEIVGNHCSYSMIRSYQQVINFTGSGTMKPSTTSHRGKFLMFPKGSDLEIPVADDSWYSADLFKHNGQDKVFEAFALLAPGDMLYKHINGSGHTRMVASTPVVVRKANGKIDHKNSYLTVIEQTNAWFDKSTKNTTWFVDKKYTFTDLYATSFMPITFKFFNEPDPVINDAYIAYSTQHTPETIKTNTQGTITSNYAFSYVLATLEDANGKLVEKWILYSNLTTSTIDTRPIFAALKIRALPPGTYTYNLRAGIARGNCDIETITFTVE